MRGAISVRVEGANREPRKRTQNCHNSATARLVKQYALAKCDYSAFCNDEWLQDVHSPERHQPSCIQFDAGYVTNGYPRQILRYLAAIPTPTLLIYTYFCLDSSLISHLIACSTRCPAPIRNISKIHQSIPGNPAAIPCSLRHPGQVCCYVPQLHTNRWTIFWELNLRCATAARWSEVYSTEPKPMRSHAST